jgi:hypothetical protein
MKYRRKSTSIEEILSINGIEEISVISAWQLLLAILKKMAKMWRLIGGGHQ